ncbi:hydrogenase expression/formation protein HypE [Methanosalsum zhilinae DSM 4017]|uniref:Hydrogenase expression/formation protein HypE n=1 Tax=Methanosalsum zhilinae (strain DSM 4017 / NBRC 107636 / OCM 62 / WeN5) TaxID=679901 RepID=F7XLC4_METZD|nr:hydrogenase expression/formation protein HypE [Methanosalsum zhilinae]AEH60782.1 hydrogenase expression/formation protein HypE [Methanosalsum zhilinae DSM 4017]
MQDRKIITMEHGAGGELMQALIKNTVLKNFSNKTAGRVGLDQLDDGATITFDQTEMTGEIVVTTDSYVIKPPVFPDSDIGRLSVSGTINDLAVMGATPLALTCALILPDGFKVELLERIIKSMNTAAEEVNVPIVTGDTKTIEKRGLDSIIVNTTGIGFANTIIQDSGLQAGDSIIINGFIADHGMALLLHREKLDLSAELISDAAPLWNMIESILSIKGPDGKPVVTAMKDPTRGGIAGTLNEMAKKSGNGIIIEENAIPVRSSVFSACEMLGIDPLEVANEGKVIIGVKSNYTEQILSVLKKHEYGINSAVIGKVTGDHKGKVLLKTKIGSLRYVNIPSGELIPRIC